MHLGPQDLLPVESELASLRADGHTRTRATEIVIERALARALESSTVVLVEGLSDQIALEILAARRGRNLRAEGVSVVPMGGATNIGRFLTHFGSEQRRLAGLYDAAEEEHLRRALERAGFGRDLDRAQLQARGFSVCVADLEDEFIRCLGPARIERIIEAQGELTSFRKLQNEPFHRGRTHMQHLHRFVGVHSGRKYRYARLFAEAVDLTRVPKPIDTLLAHVSGLRHHGRPMHVRSDA